MLKKFCILMSILLIPLYGISDILRWQVNENTTVDGGDIQLFLIPYPSDDDHFPAARVKLVSSDGTSSTILKIWGEDPDTHLPVEWDGDWGMEIADWEGGWGTGTPTGNQSETGYNTIHRIQDPSSPNYPPEVMEALFIMELGYNSWDESVGDYVWQTLAQSAPELYKDLVNQYMYASGDIAPSGYTSWSPNFYSVPEPSAFLLALVGASLLLLKRK